jgi:tetratricopeptide (TPR) repeat protein
LFSMVAQHAYAADGGLVDLIGWDNARLFEYHNSRLGIDACGSRAANIFAPTCLSQIPAIVPMLGQLEGLSAVNAARLGSAGQALETGRLDEAEQLLQAAYRDTPEHPEILRLQSGLFSQRGRHAEAVQLMRLALRSRGDDPLYYNTLGARCCRQLRRGDPDIPAQLFYAATICAGLVQPRRDADPRCAQ